MCNHGNTAIEPFETDGITPIGISVEHCINCGTITEVL